MNPTGATEDGEHPLGDPAWVEAIRAGDARAFEALFHAYHAHLCAFAYRYLHARDLAEEVVQEVFLVFWERRAAWDLRISVRAYLFTAVRNAAIGYLRHEGVVRRREAEIRELHQYRPSSPETDAVEADIAAAVRRAVGALPERCRLTFTLHREQGLTYAEIAQVLGVSVRTVEVQIGRALKSLRKCLAEFQP